jgi:hypothetical protein
VGVSADTQTRELLAWIAARPRTYDEAIEAWRTSCPRLSTWDDALIDGLVRVVRDTGAEPSVALTPLGREVLQTESARESG